METSQYSFEQLRIARLLLRWIVLVLPVAVAVGVMVAFFLWLLGLATNLRHAQMWLIYLLPLGGVGIVWLYRRFGKNSEAGNNLIMDEIHTPGGGIPFRMAPLVLLTTVLTHLFGGSAGREGTAVQMGGSTAEYFAQKLGLGKEDKRILLMAGMAAGFGAVFGTPVTGAIFALEVLAVGRIKYDALLPCLFASLIADITCNSLAVHHTHYAIGYSAREAMEHFGGIDFDLILLLKVLLASACFGLASFFFAELSHGLKALSQAFLKPWWLPPVLAAVLVLGISYCLGTWDYLGLGVYSSQEGGVSIVNAFEAGGATSFSWFWKLLLTAITLSFGFKGGGGDPSVLYWCHLGQCACGVDGGAD